MQAVEEKHVRLLYFVDVGSLILDIEIEATLFVLVGLSFLALVVVATNILVFELDHVFLLGRLLLIGGL